MEYQLVLPWPTSLFKGCDLLISLEDAVIAEEMNIFIFTEQPGRFRANQVNS